MNNLPFGLELGRWYKLTRPVELVGSVPTAFLDVDGEEVSVTARDLVFRESKPDYAFAYQVERMGPLEERRMMRWRPVCPEGHLAAKAAKLPPDRFACTACAKDYEVRMEDAGLIVVEPE